MSQKTNGFTLFEMSIVICIIALIMGAIVIGKSMIRGAQLQAIISDVNAYIKASNAFRDKYNYLPGDLPTATTFWGAMTGCPAPAYSPNVSTTTCNGDGNGHIGDHWLTTANDYEMFTAWQQLADAGFITGAFAGMSGTASTYDSQPNINVPGSKYPGGGYSLAYVQPQNFVATYFPANYGHVIMLGAPTAGDFTEHALLLPAEAMLIDQKMDDGLPAMGLVLAAQSSLLPACTTSDTPAASLYDATYFNPIFAVPTCSLFFITGF